MEYTVLIILRVPWASSLLVILGQSQGSYGVLLTTTCSQQATMQTDPWQSRSLASYFSLLSRHVLRPLLCRAQVLTSMETVAGNYKVMDSKIAQKEDKMQIMQHKRAPAPLPSSALPYIWHFTTYCCIVPFQSASCLTLSDSLQQMQECTGRALRLTRHLLLRPADVLGARGANWGGGGALHSLDKMWAKVAKLEHEWEKVGKVVGSKPGEVRLFSNLRKG